MRLVSRVYKIDKRICCYCNFRQKFVVLFPLLFSVFFFFFFFPLFLFFSLKYSYPEVLRRA